MSVRIHEVTEDENVAWVRNPSIWVDETGELTKRYEKAHVFDVDIDGGPKIVESVDRECTRRRVDRVRQNYGTRCWSPVYIHDRSTKPR